MAGCPASGCLGASAAMPARDLSAMKPCEGDGATAMTGPSRRTAPRSWPCTAFTIHACDIAIMTKKRRQLIRNRRAPNSRLGAEIAEHDSATTARTRRRFRTPTTTRCAAATTRSRRRFPNSPTRRSLSRKVGAAPSEKFAKVRHAVPMLSLGNIFADEEVEEFCRARPALSRPRRRRAARRDGRAEDRRPLLLAALRARRNWCRRRRAATASRARTSPPTCRPSAKSRKRCTARRRACSRCAAKSIWRTRISPRSTRARRRRASRCSPIRATRRPGSLRQLDPRDHRRAAAAISSPTPGARSARPSPRPRWA